MMMKTLLSLFLLAGVLSASPVLWPDGQPIPADDPGWGAKVYAIDQSSWLVGFDMEGYGVYGAVRNATDVMATLSFNGTVGTMQWYSGTCVWCRIAVEPLEIAGVRYFSHGPEMFTVVPGQEVLLSMRVPTWNYEWFTGPAERNAYNHLFANYGVQAWVRRLDSPTEPIPEPGTVAMLAMGAGMLWFRRR